MNSAIAQYGEVFVGRQPILSPTMKTIGYEVLYCDCEIGRATFTDESTATATVLLNTYVNIGLEQVVGSHMAFLNIPQRFILEHYCEALPKDRVVLEIIANVEPTPEIIEILTSLSQQGYTIALDDFTYEECTKPFLEIADIVKIDVFEKSEEQLGNEVSRLRDFRARLLADKVETRATYDLCKRLGFYYFQGYFFFRPEVIQGQEIPPNRIALLELMGKILDPTIPFKELVEHIRNDLSLSYKVLSYVNSAYLGLSQRVESINHAAYLVGIDRIRTWSTLIIMASGQTQTSEILVMALVRAKMCERLGETLHAVAPEKFFTVGLLSVLEALYQLPMQDLLAKLPLPEDSGKALIDGTGEMGKVLSSVKAYEEGEWMALKQLQLEPSVIRDAYLEAIEWANHFSPLIE